MLCGQWKTAEQYVADLKSRTKAPRRTAETRRRFSRWQQTTITQFGFVTNTVLVLTTASIGFAVGRASTLSGGPKYALLVGVIILGASGFLALLCSWNRLLDFRLTAQIARAAEQWELEETRDNARATARKLGDQSWCLLKCQLSTFGLGVFVVAVVLIWSVWTTDAGVHKDNPQPARHVTAQESN